MKDPGPWDEERLDNFGDALLVPQRYPELKPQCEKRLLRLVFSRELGAKIILSFFDRFSQRSQRLWIYYFIRNVDGCNWCLQYFLDAAKYAWLRGMLEREVEREPSLARGMS
jgi:hypothetical protein